MENRKDAIWLQGIGYFQAKKVKDIKIGRDYFVWNHSNTSKPVKILKKTPKSITFRTKTRDGKLWSRTLRKDRLVAYTTKESY